MKHSFSNYDECAQAFVYQESDYGKASGGRMFFEGDTLYSYGLHYAIARRVDENLILFNSNGSSVTTEKQKRITKAHIPGNIKVIEVDDPEATTKHRHRENFDKMLERAERIKAKFKKARDNKISLMEQYNVLMETALEYSKLFKLGFRANSPRLQPITMNQGEIDTCLAQQATSRERAERLRQRREAQWEATQAEYLKRQREQKAKFFGGELPSYFEDRFQYMRIDGDTVITTMHSTVETWQAAMLYQKLIEGEDILGLKAGMFTVLANDGDVVKVGCHTFQREHILDVFKGYERENYSCSRAYAASGAK